MSSKPLVSVIIPCYKTAQYLPRCIDSLLAQETDGLELVFVNDGSPDNTLEILDEYIEKNQSKKIKVIDKENEGQWKARLDGIKAASGRYIGFVDADDYAYPGFTEKLVNNIVENQSDMVICGFKRIDEETNSVMSTEFNEDRDPIDLPLDMPRLLEVNGAVWNKLFKAELLKNLPELDMNPIIFEDLILQLLIFPQLNKISFEPTPLIAYCTRKESIMTSIDLQKSDSAWTALKKVREYYGQQNSDMNYIEFIDAAAFVHLGISIPLRLLQNTSINLSRELINTKDRLNESFPLWTKNTIISIYNALKYKHAVLKVELARGAFKLNLFSLFLNTYKKFIDITGRDIKW